MNRDHLVIPEPCKADWATMIPADKKRFCRECKKYVHDLSSMARDEARALLSAADTAGLCVRYLYARSDRPEESGPLIIGK
jgi:hypothetical protein